MKLNPIQMIADRIRMSPDAQRWLSRANNGTTDAYQEHLQSVAIGTFEEYHAEAMMAAMDDAWLHGVDVLDVSFDEYHGGAE